MLSSSRQVKNSSFPLFDSCAKGHVVLLGKDSEFGRGGSSGSVFLRLSGLFQLFSRSGAVDSIVIGCFITRSVTAVTMESTLSSRSFIISKRFFQFIQSLFQASVGFSSFANISSSLEIDSVFIMVYRQ